MDRLSQLAKEREQLRFQLAQVEADMRRELDQEPPQARKTSSQPAKTKPKAKREQGAPAQTTSDNGDARQPSLKELIKDRILPTAPDGMQLTEIVEAVRRMKENGEYRTKATQLTPIVSQALYQLKEGNQITTRKSEAPPHRNLYSNV